MFISEINVYPIKSLGGISVKSSRADERGLEFDRRWMLVDENRNFLTQREFPKMATLKIEIAKENLFVSYNENKLKIPFEPHFDAWSNVKIWNSRVKAQVLEDEINDYFSDFLGIKCKLVFMSKESDRKVNPIYAVRKFRDSVSFADGYPFLLIGENSLNDLNERLENPLPMNRFRPNFVIKNSEAFAEDGWKKIRIGEIVFHVVKPCDRCVMTTIEQSTGEKDGSEPLKTLAKFRTKNGKVLFGQYLIAENAGEILKVGDEVEILENKN